MKSPLIFLILGDILTLAAITVIGFATHGETGLAFFPRMLTTFIPLAVAWFITAPWFGLFNTEKPPRIWLPIFAMMLAAPLTTILRAALLNSAALPLFTLILGSTSALGMFIWRLAAIFIFRKLAK